MATNRRDVQLLIRAKDEASKAFDAASQSLEKLLGVNNDVGASADKAGSRLQDLAKQAGALDKAYAQISSGADTAAAAFARQEARLAENRAQLAALEGQANGAAAALKRLNSPDAIVDAGRDQSGRLAQIKLLETQYDKLIAQQDRLRASLAQQEAALDGQRSSLQQIGSVANAAEIAQDKLRRTIEQETIALLRQTSAAERNAQVLRSIEAATGVTRDTGELGLLNQQIAAQQEKVDKLRAEQDAQTELLRIEQARARAATLLPGAANNVARGSAAASAAVFDAAYKRDLADSEGLLRANAAAERDMAEAAARLRAQIDPMAGIQDRLNKELAEANTLYRAGKISATEMAQATALLKANADRAGQAIGQAPGGKPALFGLTPYAVQNLGYQINDVVTQIASGTSVTQTLAQQGGQIIQIFPRAGAAIVAALTNPAILVTVAAVGALVLGLKEVGDQASRLRELEGALTASGNGAAYQAKELANAAETLDRYGLSAKDAISVVRTFVKEGLNPELFVTFGQAAQDMADVMGTKVPDAASKLANAFTGGYDAIVRLNEETNTYTTSELELIRTLFEEGRAHEARARGLSIYVERMGDAADKARGPWTDAIRSLDTIWQAFLNRLAQVSVVRGITHALNELADAVSGVGKAVSSGARIDEINREVARLQRNINELNSSTLRGGKWFRDNQVAESTAEIQRLIAERERLIDQNKRIAATDPAQAEDPVSVERRRRRLAEIRIEEQRDALDELRGQQRIEEAGRLAFEREMLASGDRAIAQAMREQAIRRETERVQQAQVQAARELAQETERQARAAREAGTALNQTIALIKAKEGFRSSAYWDVNAYRVGYGSDTTTDAMGRVSRVSANTTGVTEADAVRDLERRIGEFVNVIKSQIGAERYSAFSAQQQAALTSIAYNYGSLPERIISAVKTGSSEEIAAAVRGLGNDNGGVNRARRNQEADMLAAPNQAIVADNAEQDRERLDRQKQYTDQLDRQIRTRALDTRQMRELVGLSGEQLLAKQREQAIEDAIAKAREDATKAGIPADDPALQARLVLLAQTTGAYFDLANAKAAAEAPVQAAQREMDALTAQRQALMQAIEFERNRGNNAAADTLETQLNGVNAALTTAINNFTSLWQTIANNPEALAALGKTRAEVEGIILSAKNAIPPAQNLGTQFLQTGRQINESLASGVASAFDRFAQSVANGENVIDSLKNAFLQFASDFLRQIAQMILKQVIFNLVSSAMGGGGGGAGGVGGTIASFIGKMFHDGGVVGQGGTARAVDSSWFANATRYHTGGIAGLRPNEMPAILQKGEEVLTRNDPRHIANGGGGGGGGAANVKVVNVFDPAEALRMALQTKVGEQVMLSWVRDNQAAFGGAASG